MEAEAAERVGADRVAAAPGQPDQGAYTYGAAYDSGQPGAYANYPATAQRKAPTGWWIAAAIGGALALFNPWLAMLGALGALVARVTGMSPNPAVCLACLRAV